MKILSYILMSLAFISSTAFSAEADLFKGLTAEQALEKSHDYHRAGTASVQVFPDRLVAKFNDGSEIQIPTKDQHLLSIAPYENQTHPCSYHVPTSCQGEMVEKTMAIKIVDLETDEVLKEGEVTTQKDGFIDLWLPKNKEKLQVSFSYEGKSSQQVFSTNADSLTCITTMQLL